MEVDTGVAVSAISEITYKTLFISEVTYKMLWKDKTMSVPLKTPRCIAPYL